jgi:hypothetical protein
MKKGIFYVIVGDTDITKLMQAADIFDKSKIIASIQKISVEYKEDVDLTIEYAGNIIEKIKNELEEEGHIVVFIHLESISIDDVVTENMGDIPPYINKSIRSISDGEHWVMLYDVLERLGVKVEYNENYFII